ncbi:phytanoyl-CoA dioxygenase family protein [Pacificispira sp.]|uniref:phytanoyl-CoA dioxygenase family protein n=1 Tax=Pacificispira sp. TaxID=2888761 RepID=UPI003B52D337
MPDGTIGSLGERFLRDGFVAGVPVLTPEEAAVFRTELEAAEARFGGSMHYILFPNLVFRSADRLLRHPRLLDAVEAVLGPDILAYECTYIIKEPGNTKRVSWHQDLTYWGLDTDDIVSAWLALSPATEESGCMRMIPGSHRVGQQRHVDLREADNILSRGQTIQNVDETTAVSAALAPGELSLHHGWTMHASHPNRSADRRIGFNTVFMKPSVRQKVQERECAILMRGQDNFQYYNPLPQAQVDFDPEMMALREEIDRRRNATWQTG